MKLNKTDLQSVFSIAKEYYISDDKGELDNQQFIAKCYTKALATVLHLEIAMPEERIFAEPTE